MCVLALSTVLGTFLYARDVSAADGGLLMYAQERIYRVTITTSVDIPEGSKISRLMVSQGLPTGRPWSEGEHNSSARNIVFAPTDGNIEHDSKTGATFISWEERVPGKGGTMTFTTTYDTTSVTRELKPEAMEKARWKSRRLQIDQATHSEIVEQAQTLIKEPNPLGAFHKFTEWLNGRISYDATLNNIGVEDTLAKGGGHCGDYARIFLQFAKAIGIPSRPIGGSNLNDEDGGANKPGFKIKPIWSNTHAWVELEIPGLGWVETEPAAADNPFRIPARYVQNRGLFQNFRVMLKRRDGWVEHEWKAEDDARAGTRFVSDVGLQNVIKFEVLRGSETESEGNGKAEQVSEAQRLLQQASLQ